MHCNNALSDEVAIKDEALDELAEEMERLKMEEVSIRAESSRDIPPAQKDLETQQARRLSVSSAMCETPILRDRSCGR
jgi:hypothetical protein